VNVVIPCACGHHETDTVTLRERLGFREALTVRNEVILLQSNTPDASTGEVLATLTAGYLIHGIESWTLTDDKGKPVPVTRDNIRDRLLAQLDKAIVVADAADALYSESVMLPLLLGASNSSRLTPTSGSTPRPNGSGKPHPTRSRRSLTSTTQTDATGTTGSSPGGASSS
jgi:hypothetical protein